MREKVQQFIGNYIAIECGGKSFAELDSLDLLTLLQAVEAEFGLPETPDEELKMLDSIEDIAAYVERIKN
jgi:acyl carrier protein